MTSSKEPLSPLSLSRERPPRTMNDLPPEIIWNILEYLSTKHLNAITSVSQSFRAIVTTILEYRLHHFLKREYDSVYLRVGWYTPMREKKGVITWAHQGTVALVDEKNPCDSLMPCVRQSASVQEPTQAQENAWYSIFHPAGPRGDPWFRPGTLWWSDEDGMDGYTTNLRNYCEDDRDLGEEVTLESYEDFVQFRLRMYLAERTGPYKAFKIENKMIRIPKEFLSQSNDKGRHIGDPEAQDNPELFWVDSQKTIGLQVMVTQDQENYGYEDCTGTVKYYVSLSALWIRTLRLLQEDEVAEKHAKDGHPPITILTAR
ncbi:uncharacterized protein N7484_005006 [Penicillium longicatenatum]|uniref:uncharacterized protein n=1 Tax=Penicillium longicatenatum TaxID=1561947 RepID=UPI002546E0B8|nr:uncharacterized protein N7484_005006 [Penicillium longicatenatum]KAJ5651283.1 hypothetical protein N7484_005006 [Penicillium longicatenatum]